MGNKTLKNTRENEPSTAENKGIISKEFFASHFCRTLFLSVLAGLVCESGEKTSCKSLCIIIMKVFKPNRIKKSEIQIMLGTEVREENNHA